MFHKYSKEQLLKIGHILNKLEEKNKNILDVDIKYLKKYFNIEDIAVLYKILFELAYYDKNKVSSFEPQENKIPEIEWEEVTPYTILNIQEKNYSNEQLLEIVQQRISYVNNNEKELSKKQHQIDNVLDSYNEIIKKTKYKK